MECKEYKYPFIQIDIELTLVCETNSLHLSKNIKQFPKERLFSIHFIVPILINERVLYELNLQSILYTSLLCNNSNGTNIAYSLISYLLIISFILGEYEYFAFTPNQIHLFL